MKNINLVENKKIDEQLDEKVQIVLRQTDYTEEQAREKLEKFNFDELSVIRDYFGITEKKEPKKIVSINQAIYKELRSHLDETMRNYCERKAKSELKNIN